MRLCPVNKLLHINLWKTFKYQMNSLLMGLMGYQDFTKYCISYNTYRTNSTNVRTFCIHVWLCITYSTSPPPLCKYVFPKLIINSKNRICNCLNNNRIKFYYVFNTCSFVIFCFHQFTVYLRILLRIILKLISLKKTTWQVCRMKCCISICCINNAGRYRIQTTHNLILNLYVKTMDKKMTCHYRNKAENGICKLQCLEQPRLIQFMLSQYCIRHQYLQNSFQT